MIPVPVQPLISRFRLTMFILPSSIIILLILDILRKKKPSRWSSRCMRFLKASRVLLLRDSDSSLYRLLRSYMVIWTKSIRYIWVIFSLCSVRRKFFWRTKWIRMMRCISPGRAIRQALRNTCTAQFPWTGLILPDSIPIPSILIPQRFTMRWSLTLWMSYRQIRNFRRRFTSIWFGTTWFPAIKSARFCLNREFSRIKTGSRHRLPTAALTPLISWKRK